MFFSLASKSGRKQQNLKAQALDKNSKISVHRILGKELLYLINALIFSI